MTDIADLLDELHADPSPPGRITSRILDDVTGRDGVLQLWEGIPPIRQAEIVATWKRIVHDVLAEADTTVSPSGMVRVHVQPSGGRRALMASEVRTVTAALAQAFVPGAEPVQYVVGCWHPDPAGFEGVGGPHATAADALAALAEARREWPDVRWAAYTFTKLEENTDASDR